MATATLKISDRCDACGAQAFVMTRSQKGLELKFCAHDYRKNEDALKASAARVVADDRHLINASPSVSANAE
ncbi:DUF7455 domain-containing protein [Solicola sp. PLA-1-18]|uniref:DUF7455 domain-containing protein n=1 Tax=Solicola sp. PLA-1-18 TaxID=3380532 RepID=UPI003B7CDED4